MSTYIIPADDQVYLFALTERERGEISTRLSLLAAIETAPGQSWIAKARYVARANTLVRGASVRSLQRLTSAFERFGWRGLVSRYRPQPFGTFKARTEAKPWAKGFIESQFRAVAKGGI